MADDPFYSVMTDECWFHMLDRKVWITSEAEQQHMHTHTEACKHAAVHSMLDLHLFIGIAKVVWVTYDVLPPSLRKLEFPSDE